HRGIEITQAKMLELASVTPTDGKSQIQQLLALRALGGMGAKVKADRRVMDTLQQVAEGKKASDPLGFAREYALAALDRIEGREPVLPTMPKDSMRKDAFAWFPLGVNLVGGIDLRHTQGVKVESTDLSKFVEKMIKRGNQQEKFYDLLEKAGNVRFERIAVGF